MLSAGLRIADRARQLLAAALCMALVAGGGRAGAFDVDASEFAKLQRDVLGQLEEGKFAALEDLAEQWRRTQPRTATGAWKLPQFYMSFEAVQPGDHQMAASGLPSPQFEAWLKAYPDSPTPVIASARTMLRHARQFRGRVADPGASAKASAQAYERVRLLLERHKSVVDRDPEWFSVRIELAVYQGQKLAELAPLLAEAERRHPTYLPIAYAVLLPHIGAMPTDVDAIDAVVRRTVDRVRAEEGEAAYARLYWYLHAIRFRDKLFTETKVEWPRLKAAMSDLVVRSPDPLTFNAVAAIACLQGDIDLARKFMAQAKGPPLPMVWYVPELLQRCTIEAPFPEPLSTNIPQGVLEAAKHDERAERRAIMTEVRNQFYNRNFPWLTAKAEEYRTTQARTRSGILKLTLFYAAFKGLDLGKMGFSADRPSVPPIFRAWMTFSPQSPAPVLALSAALQRYAWSTAGAEAADSMPTEARGRFDRTLRFAKTLLSDHRAVASVDPAWHVQMIRLARAAGDARASVEAVFAEAIARGLPYHETYFAMAAWSLPEAGGSYDQLEALAAGAAASLGPADQDEEMYARIYWAALDEEGKNRFDSDVKVNRTRLKTAFAALADRHRDQFTINNAALFACLAGDAPETQRLFGLMVNGALPQVWRSHELLAHCEDMQKPGADRPLPSWVNRPPLIESEEDQREYDALKNAQSLFYLNDYAALEALAQLLRLRGARTANGTVKLALFYAQFRQIGFARAGGLDDVAALFDRWRKAHPNSATPVIAAARASHAHAMSMLHTGLPKLRDRAFAVLKDTARRLAEAESLASTDSEWFAVALDVMAIIAESPEDYAAMLSAAVKKDASYRGFYLSLADLGQWAGARSNDDVDRIVRLGFDAAPKRERTIAYARLYQTISKDEGWRVLTDGRMNWMLMKQGVRELLERRPAGWAANEFAITACVMGDGAETRRLLEASGNKPMPSVWRSSALLRYCQRLAAGAGRG